MFNKIPQSSNEFYSSILTTVISSLKINTWLDNFDRERFNFDGIDHSLEFNTNERAYYFDWFFKNYLTLYESFNLLENSTSKILYLYLIAYRMAGHHSIKLPLEFILKKTEYDRYKKIENENTSESKLAISGMFGKLKHYDFNYKEKHYIYDGLGLEYYLFRNQYFYSSSEINIQPELGDHIIDGGACTGDTALVFSNAVGQKGTVSSFDPVAEHLDILSFNTQQFPYKNVKIMPYGLSDKNIQCEPIIVNSYSPGFKSGHQNIPLRSIDNLVNKNEIGKIDFIKLDIEGSELEALIGAQKSILEFKPKIAVSLYHKPNDIFELILFIKKEFPFYKLYLDHYTIHQEETVLYCIA